MKKYIPRGLAFDMLFGSNKIGARSAIDAIYDGWISLIGSCGECEHYRDEDEYCAGSLNCYVYDSFYCKDFKKKEK